MLLLFKERMKHLQEREDEFKSAVKGALDSARAEALGIKNDDNLTPEFKQKRIGEIHSAYKAKTDAMRESAAKAVSSIMDKTVNAARGLYATAPSEEAHRMALMLKEKYNPGPGEVDSAVRCANGNPSALSFIASMVPAPLAGRVPAIPKLEEFEAAAKTMEESKLRRISQYGVVSADELAANSELAAMQSTAYTTGCTNINLRQMIADIDALSEGE